MIVLCANKCVLSSVCFSFFWGGGLGFLFRDFHGSTIQSIPSFIDGRIYVFTRVKTKISTEKIEFQWFIWFQVSENQMHAAAKGSSIQAVPNIPSQSLTWFTWRKRRYPSWIPSIFGWTMRPTWGSVTIFLYWICCWIGYTIYTYICAYNMKITRTLWLSNNMSFQF